MTADRLTREKVLERLRGLAPELRARGVSRLDLFGSLAQARAHEGSDVDLLVELSRPMGFEFFALQDFLAAELGVRVDLATRAGLRPRVLAEAEKHLVRVL